MSFKGACSAQANCHKCALIQFKLEVADVKMVAENQLHIINIFFQSVEI